MPVPHAKVIVNPVAGGRSVSGEWPRIRERLHDVGLSFDHEFTRGVGHGIEIAKRATDAGYGYLIVVGGDGTVNEVVNGILCSTRSGNTILGIISAGTGCNFARSLNITRDYDSACSLLAGTGRASIDVGVIRCWSQKRPLERFFVNAANVGLGAVIVDAWKHLPIRLGRNISHTLRITEGLRSLSTYRNKWLKLSMGNKVETICACNVVVANGQYFANGMQIAPHARLDDGLLDVVTFGDVGKSELLKIWPTLYRGSHMGHPKIREQKTTAVAIESDEQLLIEADGDVIGESPVSFRVIPSALTIVV